MLLSAVRRCYKLLLTVCIPLFASLIFLWDPSGKEHLEEHPTKISNSVSSRQPHGLFVITVMTLYWVTECIPLAVTSFVPVVLFPLFGILSSEAVAAEFLKDTILFLLGGCIIALSFEYCNLHTRIALRVILAIGAHIPNLLMGIMGTAMLLSMWMNNTSCTSMMIPLVNVIMEEFKKTMSSDEDPETTLLGENEDIIQLKSLKRTPASEKQSANLVASFSKSNNAEANLEKPTSSHSFEADSEYIKIIYQDPSVLDPDRNRKNKEDEVRNIKIMFLVATAYAGYSRPTLLYEYYKLSTILYQIIFIGVITGTGTNLIAAAQLDLKREELKEKWSFYEDPGGCLEGNFLQITFLDWMYFAVIPMLINTFICWLYLQVHFLGLPVWFYFWRKKTKEEQEKLSLQATVAKNIKKAIRKKYIALGPLKFDEIAVLIIFLFMVVLWVFRDPHIFPGWGTFFKTGLLKDATPTLLMSSLLFVIPRDLKYYKNFLNGGFKEGMKDPLMAWQFAAKKLPWGPFLLLGGGSAMAAGSKASGLNDVIGDLLKKNEFINTADAWTILLVVLGLISIFTSVASNTATAAIVSPVLISLAISKSIHPLYLLMPPTIAASYAFVLPVSTPPNAIVFDQSDMKQTEMMKPGILATILCNLVLFVCTNTILEVFFHFQSYNGTCNMIIKAW